jgi:cardiolipin synthase
VGLERPLGKWRDAHVRIRGPAVHALETVFSESWFRADGPDRPWPSSLVDHEVHGTERVAVLADGPTYHRRRVRDLIIDGLASARRSACFASPYFIPGTRVLDALAAAGARGVQVSLLLAGRTDHPFVRWAAHGRLPHLLERNVQVFEYDESMLHSKVAIFDDSWAMLGTSNLDRQSLQYSYEVNLVMQGGTLPKQLAAMLAEDIAASRPITTDSLAREPLPVRVRDRFAAFVMSLV